MPSIDRASSIRIRLFAVLGMLLVIMATAGSALANNKNRTAYPSVVIQYTVRCASGTLQFSTDRNAWASAYCHTYVSGEPWFDGLTFQLYAGDRANVYPQYPRRICPNTPFTGNGTSQGKFYVC